MQGRARYLSLRRLSTLRFSSNLVYLENAVTAAEEETLVRYVAPLLMARRYEDGHWDSVISKYKEIELVPSQSPPEVRALLTRLAERVMAEYEHKPVLQSMLPPHVVDLAAEGSISPHVDNIRHSGAVLAGLSLLSTRVMRLEKEADREKQMAPTPESVIEQVLKARSLYMLKGPLRYEYAHSILGPNDTPLLSRDPITFKRRISIVFRDAVSPQQDK